jgi:nucleoside-diphosphate-sugar epimerase
VLEMISRVANRRPVVKVNPAERGDMRDTFADTRLAHAHLGFVPSFGLEAGLATEYEWLRGVL